MKNEAWLLTFFAWSALTWVAGTPWLAGQRATAGESELATYAIAADQRLEGPARAIAAEYARRSGTKLTVRLLPAEELNRRVAAGTAAWDVVLIMADKNRDVPVARRPGAQKVAWKYPGGQPVWAAAVSRRREAARIVRFFGGPAGHRLWAESPAGFTITSGKTHAEAFQWVAEHRLAHTYPMTAMRMIRQCGGPGPKLCIDIGCGPGNLDVELARRSQWTIIGLDIDPDMQPLFEKKIRQAGFQDRVRFVAGDAQRLPFRDDYADVIVSRGTLIFIPDIGKCLREVARVLKPTGVAFLGGRYLYTPQKHKITTERLRQIVRESGVAGARVIDQRGQWVKIVGPEAPESARRSGLGPDMLAGRFAADYGIIEGQCLLIARSDGALEQAVQKGFVELTRLQLTVLYPSEELSEKAARRLRQAGLADRIATKSGDVHKLPFDPSSFDAVVGVGPILLWGDREQAMREIHRVLRPDGVALVGGQFRHMPDWRRVSSETLRASAAKTGIRSIRVIDDMGQWVEIRKGLGDGLSSEAE